MHESTFQDGAVFSGQEFCDRILPVSQVFFCKEDGSKIKSIRTAFKAACRRADIKDFHFHDTRHTFASWLAMSGESLYTIADLLGHKSIEMTKRYAHLSEKRKKEAAERLDTYLDEKDTNVDIPNEGHDHTSL